MFASFHANSHCFFCTCFQLLHLSCVKGVRTHQASLRYEKNGGFSVLFAFVHSMHRSRRHLAQNSASFFIPKAHGRSPKAEDYHRCIYEGSGCQKVSGLRYRQTLISQQLNQSCTVTRKLEPGLAYCHHSDGVGPVPAVHRKTCVTKHLCFTASLGPQDYEHPSCDAKHNTLCTQLVVSEARNPG